MKTLLKNSLILVIFALSIAGFAQESLEYDQNTEQEVKIRPIRIGAKIGFPNLIGGNLEYVTPLLEHKLAVYIDFSKLNSSFLTPDPEEGEGPDESEEINFKYLEGGFNYYFFKPGKGLYAGLSYGSINVDATLNNVESKEDPDKLGKGYIDSTTNSFNLKLGAKLGGLFYFRPEIGYSFTSLPKSVDKEVVFEDGSSEMQTEEFDSENPPFNLLYSGFMVNIGIGFAF